MTAIIIDLFGVRWSLAQRAEQLSARNRAERFAALYQAPDVVVPVEEDAEPAEEAAENAAESTIALAN